ncbi:MAG TPA: UPF0182 family protein [Methanothrix sp.]|nr:UPF0182 family protein [Methanothrix sp.]
MRFERGLVAALILLLIFSGQIAYMLTEWRWFATLGLSSVYETMITARIFLFLGSALAFLAVTLANLKFVGERPRYLSWVAVLVSALFGLVAQLGWERVLLALNASTFGVSDPLFGMDVGFYVFTLPLLWALWYAIFFAVLINLAVTAGAYLFLQADRLIFGPEERDYAEIARSIPQKALAHLSALLGILALLFSFRYLLDRYDLLYSATGVVYGAGYADVNARLPFLYLYAGVALLAALLLFAFAAGRRPRRLIPIIGVIVVATAVLGVVYPAVVQQYSVAPNEIVMESPFIANNINYTLLAYGLDGVDERPFSVDYNLTGDDLLANSGTVDNIRLWDWRPLLNTYKQLQEIRLYYEFFDVDVDRYDIDGEKRQVMLSARELSPDELPDQAKTWQNLHLFYTHGYGICMSPANVVTPEGLPEFYVKNLPPESALGEMARPEIYFGEGRKDYIIVKTGLSEFDYPRGDENVYATYNGTGGMELDPLMRLLMAYRLASLKILLSDDVTSDSRVMIYRNVIDRANTLAPFLAYDRDPYIVFADGGLYWVVDAYTLTDRYPYSEPSGGFNYIRNSVKVVIDAYNGTVRYYVVEVEPMVLAYQAIFPDLFLPLDSMPEELRAHLRYPVDLFGVQAGIYRNYHMKDPQVFYNREDAWDIPTEVYEGDRQTVEPYYVIMKTPGSERGEEFMLIQPFTPRSKNNMIAWMCAKSDEPDYGDIVVFKFPKDQLIYGPLQIEARIDQDTEISEQLTLWSQKGSSVIRGNLLVIPIERSLLYVEPLFLRAENSELPELKRVIVAYDGQVAMEETLEEALATIFEFAPETAVPGTAAGRGEDLSTAELIGEAGDLYRSAQDQLRAGNWSGYGEDIDRLGEVIRALEERTGTGS